MCNRKILKKKYCRYEQYRKIHKTLNRIREFSKLTTLAFFHYSNKIKLNQIFKNRNLSLQIGALTGNSLLFIHSLSFKQKEFFSKNNKAKLKGRRFLKLRKRRKF